jgi:hypothetical protein
MNGLRRIAAVCLSMMLGCVLLAGCHISSNKNGKNDNVDIGTPFGSMSVKTNDNVDSSAIGLSQYPGSVPVKDDGDNDAADVNLNFGNFHLGVKAAGFQTNDSVDKVLAFYRKDMSRYGDVIECRDHEAIGQPTHTAQGLSCDKESSHVSTGNHSDADHELRAGSELHQHVVSVESKNGGTKIGLVMLNLPTQTNNHDGKQSE